MGWRSFISDAVDTVSNAVSSVVDTASSAVNSTVNAVQNHPLEVAAVAGGAYYGAGALGYNAADGAAALAPVSDAVSVSTADMGTGAVSGIDLGGAGASPASWTNATTSTMSGSATSGWTAGQILATTSAGLNLATSGIKLAALGKTMNASTPTADGLTGGLATSPIQTPSGLITATPQGPVTAGPVASTTGGFMGMDNQTLLVIAFSMGAIWYLMKHGK